MADQFTAAEMLRELARHPLDHPGATSSALTQAADTLDRIEQMREWLAKQRVDITGRKSEFMAGCATENTLTVNQFARLFPKGKE